MTAIALALYLGGFAGDAITTRLALGQGGREVLLTQSPLANDVLIASQATALYLVTRKIQRPRLRWTVRLIVAGVHGAAMVHNLRQVRR